MDTRETLIAMRELLTPEDAWTQGAAARNKSGEYIDCQSEEASSFCIEGASLRVASTNHTLASRALDFLHDRLPTRASNSAIANITLWNDNPRRTKAEVLALLDRCIAELTPWDGHNHDYVSWDDLPIRKLEDA